jgi:hypothetical protein
MDGKREREIEGRYLIGQQHKKKKRKKKKDTSPERPGEVVKEERKNGAEGH